MATLIDTKIAGCASWTDFRDLASHQKNTKDMGDLFERLTQLYLQTHPTYRSKIKNVWWCNNGELPEEVRKKLNLPETDEGIDLLCETYRGEYWSVQSKYQTNSDRPLNYKKLSTFLSLSFVTAKGISTGLVVHTSTKKVKKSHLMGNTVELGLQHWLDITDGLWDQILDLCKGNLLKPPEKRKKRKHQELAIGRAKEHFLKKGHNRGKLIMPCGTGKSLIAYWSAQEIGARTVIVAVPSLALVKQSLEDWTSEYLAEGVHPEWMAVCSDDSVGKMREADSTVATVYEAGIPTTTDPTEIVSFIQKKSKNPKVIFTTYQSSPKLAEACKQEGLTIDLLIADEAHKTVGRKDKKFATVLSDENIKIKQRMFMTATERVYRQGSENIASMDDESFYGKIFHQMSFKQAIDDGIICDYKILTVAVSGSEVENLMAEHTEITAQLGNQKVETDAHNLAAGIAIEKVFEKHKIKHALSFHRSIKRAEDFNKQQDAFSGKLGSKLLIENRNISSKLSAGQRSQFLTDFTASDRSLISNARCLTEGVDIPSIDCVAFVDPKQSTVDIVQAAGRAMRQSEATGKTHGYILIPIIVPDGQDLDQFAQSTDFAAVARVITSLSTQDERVVDELRHRELGQPPNPDDIIIIDPDIIEALDVDYETFNDVVSTRIWASVGRANWRSFEEAREYVHELGFTSVKDWFEYSKSELRPCDIPSNPKGIYAAWIDWGDWLGTGTIATIKRNYMQFNEAKKFLKQHQLKNLSEYRKFIKRENLQTILPANPHRVYDEWVSSGDWLGTGFVATKDRIYLDFDEARAFARKQGLNSQNEWFEFWGENKLTDIPRNPYQKYDEWISWADWLDTSNDQIEYWSFQKARAFVQSLGLKNSKEWKAYCENNEKPKEVPIDVHQTYKDKGWVSFPDFFRGEASSRDRSNFLSYDDALKIIHPLKISSETAWRKFKRDNVLPDGIPKTPESFYIDFGWISWPHWLGTKRRTNKAKSETWINFHAARKFFRTKNLKSQKEWREFTNSSEFPSNIPKNPEKVYNGKGWVGLPDFLGYEALSGRQKSKMFLPFEKARNYARSLKLQKRSDWKEFASSDKRPTNIPAKPEKTYHDKGWIDYKDWLTKN